jgi:hypothetical protein
MLNDSYLYVLLILLVTLAQVLVHGTTVRQPVHSITEGWQQDSVYRHRSIQSHTVSSSKSEDGSPQQWSWDEVDSEPVEERSTPYRSHKINEDYDAVAAAIKARLGGAKHRKHHRHDIHLHLPSVPQNRSGAPYRSVDYTNIRFLMCFEPISARNSDWCSCTIPAVLHHSMVTTKDTLLFQLQSQACDMTGSDVMSQRDPQHRMCMRLAWCLLDTAGSAHKPCPAGCEARGNCNSEEGRCECPFGWTGPACEVAKFPACKISDKSDEVGRLGGGNSGGHGCLFMHPCCAEVHVPVSSVCSLGGLPLACSRHDEKLATGQRVGDQVAMSLAGCSTSFRFNPEAAHCINSIMTQLAYLPTLPARPPVRSCSARSRRA